MCVCVLQDIGESETHELEALYKPLLQGLLEAVLANADLSSQGTQPEGLDLKQLVRWHAAVQVCTAIPQYCVLSLLSCQAAWPTEALMLP